MAEDWAIKKKNNFFKKLLDLLEHLELEKSSDCH